ncbi:Serine/threonine-protein kinase PknB [Adhaeretor mobilis]|uniref:Serine/threonine-protein kinase PknB n=1 Tax=Adhaeretor mobilis TaxID=1930276 RepID=A0A517MZM5_9BACT|nr:Serine/threonine-protein kinase PknB [Adhaeretor mobilis]
MENEDALWDLIAKRIDELSGAWEALADKSGELPDIQRFLKGVDGGGLPNGARLLIGELVKTDLEQRWQRNIQPQLLEDYVRDHTQLGELEQLPTDLIYEEFQARIQAGHAVYEEEIRKRFPKKADALCDLLGGMAISGSPTCTYFAGTRIATDHSESQAPSSIEQKIADLQPGDQIDDFQLVATLGSGAFARVFLARQLSMERLVALKISATSGREPQTLAQLDHPNIIRVFDQRECKSPPALLLYMEVAQGGSLHDLMQRLARARQAEGGVASAGEALLESIDASLARVGITPPADSSRREELVTAPWVEVACQLGAEIAEGLAYAHDRGVLHRDIKPANVLLTAEATPKLADFNVSYNGGHAEEDPKDAFGGSLAYMSPEQLEACHPLLGGSPQMVRETSDIFAFGVMMWEMLTGKRPFRDELSSILGGQLARLQRMIELRRKGDFADTAKSLPDDCPPPLRRTLARCLQPAPENRFQSAHQLAKSLRLCLHERAWKLLEPPESTFGRIVLRWPVLFVILAALLPNLLTGAYNYFYNKHRMSDQWPELYQRFDRVQLVINAVAFPLGVVIVWWVMVKTMQFIKDASPASANQGVKSVLLFGHFASLLIVTLWTISGAAFPIAIAWGNPTGQAIGFYLHFFISLAVCGLAATAYPFFFITTLATQFLVPALVRNDTAGGPQRKDLRQLAKLSRIYLALASLVPMLAVLLAVSAGSQQRWALIVASSVGVFGLGAMFLLERQIRLNIEALEKIAID